MLAAGDYESAAAYLEQLDGNHPARHVNHGRDVERERVLRALGTANLELGRKRASLESLRRSVEFDERNYLNHFLLASAALELREPDEAVTAFERVLAIHPNHLPTVAALIEHHFDGADYASVTDTYEAYLDAFLIHEAAIRLGSGVSFVDVRVDGYYHEIDVPIPEESRSGGTAGRILIIDGGPYSFGVARIALVPPRRSGVLDPGPTLMETPDGWESVSVAVDGGARQTLTVPLDPDVPGIARARVVWSLRKPVDAGTWELVARSYRNQLRDRALEDARSRSAIVGEVFSGSNGEAP